MFLIGCKLLATSVGHRSEGLTCNVSSESVDRNLMGL